MFEYISHIILMKKCQNIDTSIQWPKSVIHGVDKCIYNIRRLCDSSIIKIQPPIARITGHNPCEMAGKCSQNGKPNGI